MQLNYDLEKDPQLEPPPPALKIDPEVDSQLQYGRSFDGGMVMVI